MNTVFILSLSAVMVALWRYGLMYAPALIIVVLVMAWVIGAARAVGLTKHLHRD